MKERPDKHEIALSEEQRHVLLQLISSGKAPARQLAHARILLKIDRNAAGTRWTDEQVAQAFEMSRSTVIRIRERFVEQGLDDALNHRHEPRARSRAPGWRARSASDCAYMQPLSSFGWGTQLRKGPTTRSFRPSRQAVLAYSDRSKKRSLLYV